MNIIAKEYKEGATLRDLMRNHKKAQKTIRRIIVENKIRIRPSTEQRQDRHSDTLLSDQDIGNLVNDYKAGSALKTLIPKYNSSHKRVRQILTDNGVNITQSTHDIHNKAKAAYGGEIVKFYKEGINCPELSGKYGIDIATVHKILKSSDIEMRTREDNSKQYPIDTSDLIDLECEIGAYWFGFLLADGCIPIERQTRLVCALSARDVKHLYNLARCLKTTKIPSISEDTYLYKGELRRRKKARLVIDNKQLCDFYIKSGWFDFKQGKPLAVPNSHHFIRGLMDGDGIIMNISRGKKKKVLKVGFCDAHKSITTWFRDLICNNTGLRANRVFPYRGAYYVYWEGARAIDLCHYCYTNCTRYLDRKLNKVSPYLSQRTGPFQYVQREFPMIDIVRSYQSGMGLSKLAKKYKKARRTIKNLLVEAKVYSSNSSSSSIS